MQSTGFRAFLPIQAHGLGFDSPPPPLGPLPGVKATRIWTILAWIQHLGAIWDGVREHALLLGRTEVSWHAKETVFWVATPKEKKNSRYLTTTINKQSTSFVCVEAKTSPPASRAPYGAHQAADGRQATPPSCVEALRRQ